jgi:hypothetical protein
LTNHMDPRNLRLKLGLLVKPHGFKRSGAAWRKEMPYGLLVLEVQGSRFGAAPYVNIGIWLNAVDEAPNRDAIRWLDCGIQGRLKRLDTAGSALMAQLFDEEQSQPGAVAPGRVESVLEWFTDAKALKDSWRRGDLTSFLATPAARNWLETP